MTAPAPRRYPLPDWDRHGVAEPYLLELRSRAEHGAFHANEVDQVISAMVAELRATYETQDADRALQGLERVLANIDRIARERQQASDSVAPEYAALANERLLGPAGQAALEKGLALGREALRPETLKRYGATAATVAGKVSAKAWDGAKQYAATQAEKAKQAEVQRTARAEVQRRELAERQAAHKAQPIRYVSLRKSVFPTWLGLVALSWLALIWTAILLVPFGVGIALLASLMASFVMLPTWATVFGFAGMGMSRSATLREMGFQDLAEGDPLRATAAHYCSHLGIPVPQLGSIGVFNAFAMGPHARDATVAMGAPLRDTLTPAEVNAVLAHELGHVVSGDMRKMMLMRTFQNATVWFMAFNGAKQFLRWVTNWAAELMILGFSRKREYWADAIGASLAGKDAMIGALRKLDAAPPLTSAENTHARFMMRGRASGLLNTHPSITDRVEALERETVLNRLPRR